MTEPIVVLLAPSSRRLSQWGSHWQISTGRQRVPASRKPSIPLLRLPLLRQHFPSPPQGHPATQARTQVGCSHWFCCSHFAHLCFHFGFIGFVCADLVADGMTHTMELNALCMKLGKKPMYKPIDPYPGMRPPNFNYNVRAPGPYQRPMQQWVSWTWTVDKDYVNNVIESFFKWRKGLHLKRLLIVCPGTTTLSLQWDQCFTTWNYLSDASSLLERDARGS